ncbi:MAG: hypothetical protein SGI83_15900 [Bacteroidota bacterium]|nr:hypothetical protein [Bacteroidota bacterium]
MLYTRPTQDFYGMVHKMALSGLMGSNTKNFFSDYVNPNSPSYNTIVDIIEDKDGSLWFYHFIMV